MSPRIRVRSGGCGFFGDVFQAANAIRFAEVNSISCEIKWGAESLYSNGGTGNAWLDFFEEFKYEFGGSGGLVIPYAGNSFPVATYRGMSVRQSYNCILRAYVNPIHWIVDECERFARENLGDAAKLAVHVRGTDAAAGFEDRKTATLEMYLGEVDVWLSENPKGKVYLATDELRVLETFRREFGENVVFRDCLRSESGASIHGHYDNGILGDPVQKGIEVLMDALILAKCDVLVRGHSMVTCFSLCWNPELIFVDIERKYLGMDRTPWLV